MLVGTRITHLTGDGSTTQLVNSGEPITIVGMIVTATVADVLDIVDSSGTVLTRFNVDATNLSTITHDIEFLADNGVGINSTALGTTTVTFFWKPSH